MESMEFMFETLIFVSIEKYGFVGEETLLPLFLSMFGLEEPYLYIKVIFVGVSSVLWLVLGFGWEFRVKIGKPAKIAIEYQYSAFSTGTQSCFWARGY